MRGVSKRRVVPAGESGLQAVMELLHLFLEAPQWEESAMARAKQMWLSHYRALGKGLERATADRIMTSMLGPDRLAPRRRLQKALEHPCDLPVVWLPGSFEAVSMCRQRMAAHLISGMQGP